MMDHKKAVDAYEDTYKDDSEDFCEDSYEDGEDDGDGEAVEAEKEDDFLDLYAGMLTKVQRNAAKEKLLAQLAVQMDRDEFRALDQTTRLRLSKPVSQILYELCYDGIAVGDDPQNTSLQNNIICGGVRTFNRTVECMESVENALWGYDRARGEANFLTYFITCYKNACSKARGKDAQGQDAVKGRRKLTGKWLDIAQLGEKIFEGKRLHELSYRQLEQLAREFSDGKEKKDQITLSKLCELAAQRQYSMSLDQPMSQGDGDGDTLEGSEVCGTADAGYAQPEQEERYTQIQQRIDALPDDAKTKKAKVKKTLTTVNLLNMLQTVQPEVLYKVVDETNAEKIIDFAFVAYLYGIPEAQATLAYIVANPPEKEILEKQVAAFYGDSASYISGVKREMAGAK